MSCCSPNRKAAPTPSVWDRRRQVLRALGYPDYESYLASPRWHLIRGRVFARDRKRCGCGKPADQVHHSRYDEADLIGETLNFMRAVCEPCHSGASVGPKGQVLTPDETDVILRGLWARRRELARTLAYPDWFPPSPPAPLQAPRQEPPAQKGKKKHRRHRKGKKGMANSARRRAKERPAAPPQPYATPRWRP